MAEEPTNLGIIPKNSLDKRFALPDQENIRKRLDITREALRELQNKYPEIIGMTLYGSMVTGSAHNESDIDGFIFLEEQEVKQRLTEEDWQWAKQKEQEYREKAPEWRRSSGVDTIDRAATHNYGPMVKEAFKSRGLTDDQIRHVQVRVISPEIIEQELERAVAEELKVIAYEKEMSERSKLLKTLPPDQLHTLGDTPVYPDTQSVDGKIPAMFHLEIGQGLSSYRNKVVNTLERHGEAGERVWKQVIGRTADTERFRSQTDYLLYPRTLKDAREYFHLDADANK